MTVTRATIEICVDSLQSDLALLEELRPHLSIDDEAARGRAREVISTAANVIAAIQKLLVKADAPDAGELASDALHDAANAFDAGGGLIYQVKPPTDMLSRAAFYVLGRVALDLHDLQGEWDLWLHENPDALTA